MTTQSTGTGTKKAGESDIEKIFRMVKEKLLKIKAKDVGALPVTGGTLKSQNETILSLKRDTNGDVFIEFENSSGVSRKLGFNIYDEIVSTSKNGAVKKILLDTPPVRKETKLLASNGGFKVYGNDTSHDITDIFVKANTVTTEGIVLGKTTNRMGYVIGQNFTLDCTRLTDDERSQLQSYTKIVIYKNNDSVDYPVLAPENINLVIAATVTCKTGYRTENVKVTIASNSTRNQIIYELPGSFRNDDNSQNNLKFSSNEWVHHIGINIKDY